MFIFVLLISIVIVISSNRWLICWVALEFNLLFFIPLLLLKKNNKYNSETAFKYFVTQVIASIFILMSIYSLKSITTSVSLLFLLISIMLKIAAAPFHQWLPSLRQGLEWNSLFIILVPQKINPFILLRQINLNKIRVFFLIIFICLSAIIGRVRGLIQTSIKKIIIYSSIRHLRWLIRSLLINNWMWFDYLLIYSIILIVLIINLKKNNINFISKIINLKQFQFFFISISLLCLGGLPPFSGFLIKFIVLVELRALNFNFLIFFLILSSVFNLFFYLRIRVPNIFISNKKNKLLKFSNTRLSIVFINLLILVVGYLLLILDFKLY